MDYHEYNLVRFKHRKELFRFLLGFEQLIYHPIINVVWLGYGAGIYFLGLFEKKFATVLSTIPMLSPILIKGIHILFIAFSLLLAVCIVQQIGYVTARKDEAELNIVFHDVRGIDHQSPILIRKKYLRKKKITIREFYTTIPKEKWVSKKEEICDIMDMHLIQEISYGGKSRNCGNRIILESAKGRIPMKRGMIYDESL